jgi:hypothetical protein
MQKSIKRNAILLINNWKYELYLEWLWYIYTYILLHK